jgi:hypothetical protein
MPLIYSSDTRIYSPTHRAALAAIRVSRSREPVQRSNILSHAPLRFETNQSNNSPIRHARGTALLGTRQPRKNRESAREPDFL